MSKAEEKPPDLPGTTASKEWLPTDDGTGVMGDSQDITFAYFTVVMEMLYMCVKSSCDFFLIHGLARYVINLREMTILKEVIHIKCASAFLVIPFAVVCDSYLGCYQYFLVISGLCSFMIIPSFYFVMSFPAYMIPTSQKLYMCKVANVLHGINFLMESVRSITVIRSIMSRYQFRSKRYFFALLVFGWNAATVLAALGIYIARSSRIGYSIIMIVNMIFLGLYIASLLIFKPIFFFKKKPNFCCVEKVFANTFLYFIKKIDQLCRKKRRIFKNPGWQDFRTIKFSERTSQDSHAFLGVLLVMTPLCACFMMEVCLEHYYLIQFPMLKYDLEQFPVGGLKAAFYCLMFPIFELMLLPQTKKMFKSETGLQLSFVGIGVFLFAVALFWCSVVQHKISANMDFLTHDSKTAHLVMVNALSAQVTIRGKYYNQFMSWPEDNWFELLPWTPLRILYVPHTEIPFKVTVSCKTFSIYDDYELPLAEDKYNWYMMFPHGMVQLPAGTFHHKREVAVKPELYYPAVVNVLCRIPMCAGFLRFKQNERNAINQVIKSSQNLITLEIVGEYEVTFGLVGNESNAAVIKANFERLGVYLLVIHIQETENISINWAGSISPSTVIKTTITIVEHSVLRSKSLAYMFPALAIHALGDVLAKVSILTWLYFATPVNLRAFCFSYPTFLSFPVYSYLDIVGPMRIQEIPPVSIFSFGCGFCFVIVMYFLAALYHTHRWNTGKNVPRAGPAKVSFVANRGSYVSERSKDV